MKINAIQTYTTTYELIDTNGNLIGEYNNNLHHEFIKDYIDITQGEI